MNAREKKILTVAAVIALVMFSFPPWQFRGRGIVRSGGYNFILDAPPLGEIDFGRLLVQMIVVGGVAYGVAFAMRR